jgi:hypothetical protein
MICCKKGLMESAKGRGGIPRSVKDPCERRGALFGVNAQLQKL